MDSTVLDRRRTIVMTCVLFLSRSSIGASLGSTSPAAALPTALPTQAATNSSRFILDTANLDLNKDGCISGKAELDGFKQHVIDALAAIPDSVLRAHSIVHRTDVNRDGKICWCDFISIYLFEKASKSKHSVPFLVLPDTVMFTQLDENQDGQLSGQEKDQLEKEFESCLPHSQAQSIVAAIAGILSKDDSISREEFEEFINNPRDETAHKNPAVVDKEDNS